VANTDTADKKDRGQNAAFRIHDLPQEDRPRERLLEQGAEALTNAELLAIFINTGLKGENAIQVAQRLLTEFKSLRDIARRGAKELASVRGLGPAKAAHIAAAFELGRRAAREELRLQKIDTPELIYAYVGEEMSHLGYETLRVLLLNTRMELIHDEVVFQGSLNESVAHPREIIRCAVVHRAHAFALVHNHPSGDPSPSDADRNFTRRMRDAALTMKLDLIDHLIVGAPRAGRRPYFSFREMGML
jgi:DNA repair protein RadC